MVTQFVPDNELTPEQLLSVLEMKVKDALGNDSFSNQQKIAHAQNFIVELEEFISELEMNEDEDFFEEED